jgi:hypothetical protein
MRSSGVDKYPWPEAAESSASEVSAIPRQLDLRVHDRVALDEIDLYTDVLGAVAAADRPLTDAELDEVLGIIGQS